MVRKLRRAERRKVTAEQAKELVRVYLDHGSDAAADLSSKYGVSRNYASSLASTMGLGRLTKNAVRRSVRSLNDPRWARAKAVGMVIA